jgi:CheY-like chemotaxis protein
MRLSRSIVLVDDDRDDQEIFKTAWASIDDSVEVVGFENGELALNSLQKMNDHPDVIFLDLNLPRLNGVEILEELKHSKTLRDIPVVIYSTSFDLKVKDRCSRLGAVAVIEKPSGFEALCSELQSVLHTLE